MYTIFELNFHGLNKCNPSTEPLHHRCLPTTNYEQRDAGHHQPSTTTTATWNRHPNTTTTTTTTTRQRSPNPTTRNASSRECIHNGTDTRNAQSDYGNAKGERQPTGTVPVNKGETRGGNLKEGVLCERPSWKWKDHSVK